MVAPFLRRFRAATLSMLILYGTDIVELLVIDKP